MKYIINSKCASKRTFLKMLKEVPVYTATYNELDQIFTLKETFNLERLYFSLEPTNIQIRLDEEGFRAFLSKQNQIEKLPVKQKGTSMQANVKVDADGTKSYYNKDNQLHREDGPVVEYADGTKKWYKNGELHREDGPAVEYSNGDKFWYKNNKLHREDGPAIEDVKGNKAWYKDNLLHRDDGPAIEHANGDKYWYKNGKLLTEEISEKDQISDSKKIGKEIIKRTSIDLAMQVGQKAVVELLTLLGVRKTSKIYKFFASSFANGVLKAGVGLFLMYCPFTQEEKYQLIAEELLVQSGVSTIKDALNILLTMLAPQAQKFIELISNLNNHKIRVIESTTRVAENKQESMYEEEEEEMQDFAHA